MDLQRLFGSKDDHTWLQESARAAVIFIYGLALVRIAGRRAFGKWPGDNERYALSTRGAYGSSW